MKTLLIQMHFVAWILLGLSGCSLPFLGGIQGSGVAMTETREVSGFSSVALSGLGNVSIKQTGKESLTITADDNILPLLEAKVEQGVLHLGVKPNENIRPKTPIRFEVEVKELEGISVSGVGNVEGQNLNLPKLKATISGVGSVKLSGKTEALDLHISGTGNFQGEELEAREAAVHSSGVGNAVINVGDKLDAHVSGVGSVEYLGSPKVTKSVSGVGSVKKR